MKTALIMILFAMIFPFQFADKRKLLLFTKDMNNPVFVQQQKILQSNVKGWQERDISIETYVFNEKNEAMFAKHKITHRGFMFILVGKDGGEKIRSTTVVSNEKLYELIDRMPMRKSEMKKQ